jgi:hypothetical protein
MAGVAIEACEDRPPHFARAVLPGVAAKRHFLLAERQSLLLER